MINTNNWGKSNFRELFSEIEYIPSVYFLSPLKDRVVEYYCKIEDIIYPSKNISLKAYNSETNEIEMFLELPFDEIHRFEVNHLTFNINLTINLSIGDFIFFSNNSYQLHNEFRVKVNPLYRNLSYYKKAVERKIDTYTKFFGN